MAGNDSFQTLQQRLAALREHMEAGLPARAAELAALIERYASGDDEARNDIRRQAHKLRGVAGTYGYTDLAERSAAVEDAARGNATRGVLIDAARGLAGAITRARTTSEKLDVVPESIEEPKAAVASHLSLEGRAVLAIDDDASTRKLLELTLRTIGKCRATILESPERALALALGQEPPDFVICDAMMPEWTGLEFVSRLRDCGSDLPVVFLSAATPEDLGWTLPERTTWMRKPFRPIDFLSALGRWIETRST